jgi:hypothetical protein
VHSQPGPGLSFAPRPVLVAGVGLGAVALAGAAVTGDQLGRLLYAAAAVLLAAEALRSAVLRPVLSVSANGLVVTDALRRVPVPWAELVAVRTVRAGHLVPGRVLELETVDRAYVFGGYRLGVPPETAAERIEAARPDGG